VAVMSVDMKAVKNDVDNRPNTPTT